MEYRLYSLTCDTSLIELLTNFCISYLMKWCNSLNKMLNKYKSSVSRLRIYASAIPCGPRIKLAEYGCVCMQ